MSNVLITQVVVAAAVIIGLAAFLYLVAVPAMSAKDRLWERFATGFLSLYVLLVLVGIGVAAGVAIIWLWPQIT
ncbi:MAG: hypothetical protein WCL20_02540 [Actinomycetes bacterium]